MSSKLLKLKLPVNKKAKEYNRIKNIQTKQTVLEFLFMQVLKYLSVNKLPENWIK